MALDLSNVTEVNNPVRGGIEITISPRDNRPNYTKIFDGSAEAIRDLYRQCISEPEVKMFEIT